MLTIPVGEGVAVELNPDPNPHFTLEGNVLKAAVVFDYEVLQLTNGITMRDERCPDAMVQTRQPTRTTFCFLLFQTQPSVSVEISCFPPAGPNVNHLLFICTWFFERFLKISIS